MLADFGLTIFYAQIVVCDGSPVPRALKWTDDHVAQGFAWSPGDVSFGIPDHDGTCRIQAEIALKPEFNLACDWAIKVPFETKSNIIYIGSVLDPQQFAMKVGTYELLLQVYSDVDLHDSHYAFLMHLTFSPHTSPSYEILKQGSGLSTDRILRKDADY